jgi:hypothetical protein
MPPTEPHPRSHAHAAFPPSTRRLGRHALACASLGAALGCGVAPSEPIPGGMLAPRPPGPAGPEPCLFVEADPSVRVLSGGALEVTQGGLARFRVRTSAEARGEVDVRTDRGMRVVERDGERVALRIGPFETGALRVSFSMRCGDREVQLARTVFVRALELVAGGWPDVPPRTRPVLAPIGDGTGDLVLVGGRGLDGEVLTDAWRLASDGPRATRLPDAPWLDERTGAVRDGALHTIGIDPNDAGRRLYSATLDLTTLAWRRGIVTGGAREPLRREGAVIVHDPVDDVLLLVGGDAPEGLFDPLWSLTPGLSDARITRVPTLGERPATRLGHAVFVDDTRHALVVLGGWSAFTWPTPERALFDGWVVPLEPPRLWRKLTFRDGGVPGRWGAAAAFDPEGRRSVVWGGTDGRGSVPDVAFLTVDDDGIEVTRRPLDAGQVAPIDGAAVYVREHRAIVFAFGRTSGTTAHGSTRLAL